MADIKIAGVSYADVPQIDVPKSDNSGNAVFYDTSGDTATAANVLAGKTFHAASGSKTGSMTDRGFPTIRVSDLNGTNFPGGYYTGGLAEISYAEQVKIVPENIKSGVTILGVSGNLSAGVDFDDMFNHRNTVTIESSPSADNTDKTCYGFNAGFDLDLTGFYSVYDYAFNHANLKSLIAPDLISVGYSAFEGNSRLAEGGTLSLPALITASDYAFADCNSFSAVRLPVLQSFSTYVFLNCGYLNDVYLGHNGVVSLPADNMGTVFQECGRNSFVGDAHFTIHVPAAQLSAYQADSDWNFAIESLISSGVNASIVGDYS